MRVLKVAYTPIFAANHPFGKVNKNTEWLETSGDGSYASQSVDGINTRTYHALLVASSNPPVERNVLFQRIDDEVTLVGQTFKLSNSAYTGLKDGFKSEELLPCENFNVLPSPHWTYALDKNKSLEKQLVIPASSDGANVYIGYTYKAPKNSEPLILNLKPFFNKRSIHSPSYDKKEWEFETDLASLGARIQEKGTSDKLYVSWSKKSDIIEHDDFYDNYYYKREDERGLAYTENGLYRPFELKVVLKPNESFTFAVSTRPNIKMPDIKFQVENKKKYLESLYKKSGLDESETSKLLQRAADQFIVTRKSINGKTILAGYHWFNDWGRDTMIALPGLTLATKRFDDAKLILSSFAKYAKNGMLPNNFPENAYDSPGYNTLDASMWWFNALHEYIKAAGTQADKTFVKEQYNVLKNVIKHHMYGKFSGAELSETLGNAVNVNQEQLSVGETKGEIGMDKDGLIMADNGQLTWMDAASWDGKHSHPYTPRDGKAVEINALWYNGLKIMEKLAKEFSDFESAQIYEALGDKVQKSMQKFINPKGGLFDLIETPDNEEYFEGRGAQIRPNQAIAVSLDYSAFDKDIQKDVVRVLEEKLLTPYGLRTLAEGEDGYSPYYPNAKADERDAVYHQGPVWAWPIGVFCDAYLNAYGNNHETRTKVRGFIEPLLKHLKGEIKEHCESGACFGGIAEVFDAKEPYYSKCTINQAWSVAEVLRIYEKTKE